MTIVNKGSAHLTLTSPPLKSKAMYNIFLTFITRNRYHVELCFIRIPPHTILFLLHL